MAHSGLKAANESLHMIIDHLNEPTLTTVLLSYAISNLRIRTVEQLTFEESVKKYPPDYQYVPLKEYPTKFDKVVNAAIKVQTSRCTIC